jgi:hypothetical protein
MLLTDCKPSLLIILCLLDVDAVHLTTTVRATSRYIVKMFVRLKDCLFLYRKSVL